MLALTALLSSNTFKYIMIGLAVVGILFGTYEYGHSNGESTGYQKGLAYQQPTIDKLTNQLNAEHTAQAAKVQTIESSASNAVVTSATQQGQQQVVRTQIVDHYHTVTVPATAVACAVNTDTVAAVNALLATQVTYDTPVSLPDVPVKEQP